MLTIALDQDDVLADLTRPWVDIYNNEWGDNLQHSDLSAWEIENFVKPECGDKIYDIINRPGFFDDLEVIPGAQDGVAALCEMGFTICIASASPKTAFLSKYNWLKRHFPMVNSDNIIFTKNKSLVRADWLVDDRLENLEGFRGFKTIFTAPWNKLDNRFVRVSNWPELVSLAQKIMQPTRV